MSMDATLSHVLEPSTRSSGRSVGPSQEPDGHPDRSGLDAAAPLYVRVCTVHRALTFCKR